MFHSAFLCSVPVRDWRLNYQQPIWAEGWRVPEMKWNLFFSFHPRNGSMIKKRNKQKQALVKRQQRELAPVLTFWPVSHQSRLWRGKISSTDSVHSWFFSFLLIKVKEVVFVRGWMCTWRSSSFQRRSCQLQRGEMFSKMARRASCLDAVLPCPPASQSAWPSGWSDRPDLLSSCPQDLQHTRTRNTLAWW